jgi:hypothetical protein
MMRCTNPILGISILPISTIGSAAYEPGFDTGFDGLGVAAGACVVGGGGAVVDVVVVGNAAALSTGAAADFSVLLITAAPPTENARPARSTTKRRFELPIGNIVLCRDPKLLPPIDAARQP